MAIFKKYLTLARLFKKRRPKAGVVFLGGGLRSAIQATAAQRLFEFLKFVDTPVTYLGGASGGALNAAVIGQSRTEEEFDGYCNGLIGIWKRVGANPEKVFPLSDLKSPYETLIGILKGIDENTEKNNSLSELRDWAKTLFLKRSAMKKILKTVSSESLFSLALLYDLVDGKSFGVAPLDCTAIACSAIQLDVFAWAESSAQGPHPKKNRAISNRDDVIKKNPFLFRDAVVGSAALPPFFPAVPFNGFSLIDSGIVDYERAVNAGCDVIFVLKPHFVHIHDSSNQNWLRERLYRTSVFRAMGVIPAYIDHSDERSQEHAVRRATSLGRRPPIIIVLTLGAPTRTFLVHTCAEGDIDWALRLGESQMDFYLSRLSKNFDAMHKQKDQSRFIFDNPPHEEAAVILV